MIRLIRFLPSRWWTLESWRKWRSYLHWRLETYGVYYPENRFNRNSFHLFLRQFPSYFRWLGDMGRLRRRPLHFK